MSDNESSGNVPSGAKPQFNAARDGNVSEPVKETFTVEQQKSADKVALVTSKDKTNEAEMKSAESRLDFNVHSEDQPSKYTYAHEKNKSKETYTSKQTGATYEGDAAIKAAKKLDQNHDKELQDRSNNTKRRNDHAPALTMPGGPTDRFRGKTADASKTQSQDKNEEQKNELSARTQRLKEQSQIRIEQQQGMEASQTNNKDVER